MLFLNEIPHCVLFLQGKNWNFSYLLVITYHLPLWKCEKNGSTVWVNSTCVKKTTPISCLGTVDPRFSGTVQFIETFMLTKSKINCAYFQFSEIFCSTFSFFLTKEIQLWKKEVCFLEVLDLSKEAIWVSVGQLAAKVQAIKVVVWSYHPGVKPGPPICGSTQAWQQNFFQPSNCDSLYLCNHLTYRDSQYIYGNISTSLTYIFPIQRTIRIFDTGFALSKWPHLLRAW